MSRNKKIKIKNIILASDHAGFKLKEKIKLFLLKERQKVLDLGTKNTDSVDYPDFAHLLSTKMKNNSKQFGVLVCGSGIGMNMAANRHKSIRAALCYNVKYHNAFNGGEENRVHLVACLTDYKFN